MKDLKNIVKNYGIKHELNQFKKSEPINENSTLGIGTTGAVAPTVQQVDPKSLPVNPDQAKASEFIKKLPADKTQALEGAVRGLANKYMPNATLEDRVGYYKINGANMRLHFEPMNNGEEAALKAVFQFVENSNRATDLAGEYERATIYYGGTGVGTNEEALFSIPAALRAYCDKAGKNFPAERNAFFQAFETKSKKKVIEVAISEIAEAQEIRSAEIVYSAFWVDATGVVNDQTSGLNFAAQVLKNANIAPTDTERIASLIQHNADEKDIQKFVLTCSYDHLRKINAILKGQGVDFLKIITQNVKGDIKLAFKYAFMGAGIVAADSEYTRIYGLIANGTGNKNFIEI